MRWEVDLGKILRTNALHGKPLHHLAFFQCSQRTRKLRRLAGEARSSWPTVRRVHPQGVQSKRFGPQSSARSVRAESRRKPRTLGAAPHVCPPAESHLVHSLPPFTQPFGAPAAAPALPAQAGLPSFSPRPEIPGCRAARRSLCFLQTPAHAPTAPSPRARVTG